MKIYSKVVIDMSSETVIEEEHEEYTGEVSQCKGGDAKQYDKEYNDRMATVAEEKLDMAKDQYGFWEDNVKGLEQEKIAAQKELLPSQTVTQQAKLDFQKDKYEASAGLLEDQTEASQQKLDALTGTGGKQGLIQNYTDSLDSGLNVQDKMGKAGSDVAQSFDSQRGQMTREASRMGLDPSSGQFADNMRDMGTDKAKAMANAKTTARRETEDKKHGRYGQALGLLSGSNSV